MRGHPSSDRRILLPQAGPTSDLASEHLVHDDFGNEFPIKEAELDVIESFLLRELSSLLKNAAKPDSKQPQRSVNDNCPTS